MAETVEVPTADGPMPVYDVVPDGGPRAAVIVIQEAFGVTDHIQDVTRRAADAGYRAVAPHLFHRTGDPTLAYDDLDAIRPHLQALTQDTLLTDLDVTLRYLADAGYPAERVGVVGFCMGGSVTFLAAARHALGAAVSFYGGGVAEGRFGMLPLLELSASLRTPWLGLYGEEDRGIPMDQVEALEKAVAEVPVPTEVVTYPGAQHGFHCDARPAVYDERSAKDAWGRTLAWFDRYLGG